MSNLRPFFGGPFWPICNCSWGRFDQFEAVLTWGRFDLGPFWPDTFLAWTLPLGLFVHVLVINHDHLVQIVISCHILSMFVLYLILCLIKFELNYRKDKLKYIPDSTTTEPGFKSSCIVTMLISVEYKICVLCGRLTVHNSGVGYST